MIKNLSRKTCLLVVFMCSIWGMAHAQITLGAKTGININQFSQPGTTMGANVGIYGAYQVLPFLSVKLEPQYSQEGGGRPDYTRDYNLISDNVTFITFVNPNVTFHNVQVPLLLEFTLPEFQDEAMMPKLILGGSYGLMVSAMEEHTKRYTYLDNVFPVPSGGSPTSQLDVGYQRENVIDNYARNQWSLIFGMGMQYKVAERTFMFDLRYRQGMNNLNMLRFASPNFVPGTGGNLRSSTLSFNFSMSIFNF